MVNMMASRANKKSLLDLVLDPAQLQARIKAHEEAAAARQKASVEYQRHKAAADASIVELNKRQEEINLQAKGLESVKRQLDTWKRNLELQEGALSKEKADFELYKKHFDEANAGSLRSLREQMNEIARQKAKNDEIQAGLINRTGELENKHYELLAREASVTKREAFLVGIINQLKA